MEITLTKAKLSNCEELYSLQTASFRPLLEKYQDYDSNPGASWAFSSTRRPSSGGSSKISGGTEFSIQTASAAGSNSTLRFIDFSHLI